MRRPSWLTAINHHTDNVRSFRIEPYFRRCVRFHLQPGKLNISENKLLQPTQYTIWILRSDRYLRHKFSGGRVGRGRSIKMGTRDWQFTVQRNWQSLLGNSTEANRAMYRWQITPNLALPRPSDWKSSVFAGGNFIFDQSPADQRDRYPRNSIKGWSN